MYDDDDYDYRKLLTEDFDGFYGWIDSKTFIDEKRVNEAAKELDLSTETIRKHYEEIAKEMPLKLKE